MTARPTLLEAATAFLDQCDEIHRHPERRQFPNPVLVENLRAAIEREARVTQPTTDRIAELRRLMVIASDTTEAQMLAWLAEFEDRIRADRPPEPPTPTDAVYAERNRLVAALAHLFGDAAWRGLDPESPEFTVVYIDLPTGQVSWHIPDAEMDQFPPLPLRDPTGWDGHDTDEKYRRLAALRRGDICRDVNDAVIRAVNHERSRALGASPPPPDLRFETRPNDDGTIDEVLIYRGDECVFHLEQMDADAYWFAWYGDGIDRDRHFDIRREKKRLVVIRDRDAASQPPSTPREP